MVSTGNIIPQVNLVVKLNAEAEAVARSKEQDRYWSPKAGVKMIETQLPKLLFTSRGSLRLS